MKSEFLFFNFPLRLTVKDYQEARKNIVDGLMKDRRVYSIYSFGSVAEAHLHPGISDLDFLVLIKQKVRSSENKKDFYDKKEHADNMVKYILMGQPAAYPVSEHFLACCPFFLSDASGRLHHEWGDASYLKRTLEENEKKDSLVVLGAIAQTIEMLVSKLCILSANLSSREVDVRLTLKILNGVKYSIRRMEALGFKNERWDDCASQIANLRENWYFYDEERQKQFLIDQSRSGLGVCTEIMSCIDKFLRSNVFGHLFGEEAQGIFLIKANARRFFLFSDAIWKEKKETVLVLRKKGRLGKMLKPLEIVLFPSAIFSYFVCHARIETLLGKAIQSRIALLRKGASWEEIHPAYRSAFLRQAELYNQYWSFLSENSCTYGIGALTRLFYQKKVFGRLLPGIKKFILFIDEQNALRKIKKIFEAGHAGYAELQDLCS